MMVTDIRIQTSLPSHPKTKKLIRRIGEGGAWRLVCLFLFVAQSRPDGNLAGMTSEDIELAADWQGEEGAFVRALSEVGFLDGDECGYRMHDWEDHNPWSFGQAQRSAAAKEAAAARWKKHSKGNAVGCAPQCAPHESALPPVCAPQCAPHESALRVSKNRNAPSPSPSPSPNQVNLKPLSTFDEKPDAPPSASPPPANPPLSNPKGSRLPDDWNLPDDWRAWAANARPDLSNADIARQGECFADFWHSKPGQAARKTDWQATWRNWIRNTSFNAHAKRAPPTPERFADVDYGVTGKMPTLEELRITP